MTDQLRGLLPWAFSAGMIATINPCGFAMLPAYLSYFIGGPARTRRPVMTSSVEQGSAWA